MHKKAVGINTVGASYQIDHLAPLCILMNIPLLFLDETDFICAKKYYPKLKAERIDYEDFNPEFLISNYDVLFMSEMWNRHDFQKIYKPFEKEYQKKLRHVFCPHGFSDKGFYFKSCGDEDIVLIYGQNMIDLLKHYNVLKDLNAYAIVGNYRYRYYKKNRAFYERVVSEEVWSYFKEQKSTILYAPTWRDQEESSTFFDVVTHLIEQLPEKYNLLVKLHPNIERDNPIEFYKILGTYENRGDVLFLKDFPPVFPLLSGCDMYIGDMSSIGYDFLAFDRPMFFLNKGNRDTQNDRNTYLFRCGTEVMPQQFPEIYNVIDKALKEDKKRFSKVRKDVFKYTFADVKSDRELRNQIASLY